MGVVVAVVVVAVVAAASVANAVVQINSDPVIEKNYATCRFPDSSYAWRRDCYVPGMYISRGAHGVQPL